MSGLSRLSKQTRAGRPVHWILTVPDLPVASVIDAQRSIFKVTVTGVGGSGWMLVKIDFVKPKLVGDD